MKIYVLMFILLLIAVAIYFTMMRVLETQWTQKRKRLSSIINVNEVQSKTKFTDWLDNKGILPYISPTYMIEQSKKHGVIITKQSYMSTFFMGSVLGVIAMFIYFRPFIYLLPIALLGGVIATNIQLHKIKKTYIQLIDSKISLYMSSFATAMQTFTNPKDAINSILPSLESPLKEDVEEALLFLQDGKDIPTAFRRIVEKYPQKEMRLFHDHLDVVVKGGTSENKLRAIAFKMKKKETMKRRLKTTHKRSFKVWRAMSFFTLLAPFLFIFLSMDNYILISNSIPVSVVYIFAFILLFYTFRELEQLEIYDPTVDTTIEYQ